MAIVAFALMDVDRDISARMAVGTITIPTEVAVIMTAVDLTLIKMAVKAANLSGGHDDIVYRSVALRDPVKGPIPQSAAGAAGGVMAEETVVLVQGHNTVSAGPSVGE